MNECQIVRDLLALRPAEWGADEQRQVQAHLQTCPDCAALSRAYAEHERLIRAAPPARLTPAQRGQLFSRIHRARRRHAMNIKLSAALSASVALAALVALTLGLHTLFFRESDQATVGTPTNPQPTPADAALWKWLDDVAEDQELAHQTTSVLQRQPWWNGQVVLFTYQDRWPDADGDERQKVLAWVLAEPGPQGQDWAVTMSGSTREAIHWADGLPDLFWISEQQDSQGRTMSVIYGLWFGRTEQPQTLQLTWNGISTEVKLYNNSFLVVADGKWEERPTITWDCDAPGGGSCRVVLHIDKALPAPDAPIFGGEIRYDGQVLDPLTGKIFSLTPGTPPSVADPSTPGQIHVPVDLHFVLPWQVLAPPSADWVVFAHLLNESGELLLQSDAGAEWPQPCEGEYGPECVVATEHEWRFPADFPPGLYTIVVGLYDPATGARAPVTSIAESTASQVVLGQVQVSPETAPAYTQATLCIFSGRPNPTWTLTPGQDAELRQRLDELEPTGQAFDEMGRLGYAGIDLLLPSAEGQPEQYVQVWDGVVQWSTQGQGRLLADEERALERWLLDSAVGRVEEETLAAARLEFEDQSDSPPQEHDFYIYLFDQELAQDVSCGPAPDTSILSLDDVLTYTWQTHELALTDAAYARLAGLEVPVAPGMPFVVCVAGEPIYRGAFWTLASSATFDGIVILVPPVQNTRSIRIQLGYPSPEFFTGEDLRTDPRILEVLEKAGKLGELGVGN